MKKLTTISILIIGLYLVTFSCKTIKSTPKTDNSVSFLSQDKLGNIYQISDMKITKYSTILDTIVTNSIFSSGTISSLDTRNPLQLMLFYKQQQEIVLLDNTLSETNKIALAFFEWIDLACMSNRDNAFWLYSKTTQSLIKTNNQGKVVSRFKNIAQLVKKDIDPTQLIEYNNQVYLFDHNEGLFIFDLYGNYVKRIQLKNAENVKFFKEKVFFRVENSVFSYNLFSFDKKLEFESPGDFEGFAVGKSGVLVLTKNEIKKLF
ncbi:MAG: hypothetical protein ACPGVD_01960 [Flavobacteriales bacterium]